MLDPFGAHRTIEGWHDMTGRSPGSKRAHFTEIAPLPAPSRRMPVAVAGDSFFTVAGAAMGLAEALPYFPIIPWLQYRGTCP